MSSSSNPNSGIGYKADSVATSDAGTFSLIALIKRLLGKNPDLVGGRVPVDGSGVTQPISGSVSVSNFPSTQTQYTDGTTAATPTGNVVMGNKSGVVKALTLDTNGYLQVVSQDITNKVGTVGDIAQTTGTVLQQLRYLGDNGAIRYGDGTTQASPFGTLILGKGSGANSGKVQGVTLDSNGYLQAVLPQGQKVSASSNSVTIASDDTQFGAIGDTASSTGTIHAQLRYVGESLSGNRSVTTSAINVSASGDNTIISGVAGKKIAISSLVYTVSTSGTTTTLKDGSTAISGAMTLVEHAQDYFQPIILTAGSSFVINVSATANVRGYVIWYLV